MTWKMSRIVREKMQPSMKLIVQIRTFCLFIILKSGKIIQKTGVPYHQITWIYENNKLWWAKKRMKPHLHIHPSVQMVENKQNVIKPSEYLTDVMWRHCWMKNFIQLRKFWTIFVEWVSYIKTALHMVIALDLQTFILSNIQQTSPSSPEHQITRLQLLQHHHNFNHHHHQTRSQGCCTWSLSGCWHLGSATLGTAVRWTQRVNSCSWQSHCHGLLWTSMPWMFNIQRLIHSSLWGFKESVDLNFSIYLEWPREESLSTKGSQWVVF